MIIRHVISFLLCVLYSNLSQAQQWPGFRGPNYNSSIEGAGIFPSNAQPELSVQWKKSLGLGYSSVSLSQGIAITLFSDGKMDWVAAYDAASGKLNWRIEIGTTYQGHDGSHTGPISTPLIFDKTVFALGPHGRLMALNLHDGKLLWSVDLSNEKDAAVPYYGYGTSPLVAEQNLVIPYAVKEQFSIVGFDLKTGRAKWFAGRDTISYQVPVLAKLLGQKQVLVAGDKYLCGVDPASGKILWEYAHGGDDSASGSASIQPLVVGEDRILISNKADLSTLLKVGKKSEGWSVETLWANNSLRNTYSRPVFYRDHLYGYSGTFLTCVEAASGKTLWKSRPPGDGFILLLDGHLVILTKKGTLHLAEASPKGYQEKASLKLFNNYAWTPPSFADGLIYARSLSEIAAVRVVPAKAVSIVKTIPIAEGTRFGQFLKELESAQEKNRVIDGFLSSAASFPLIENNWVHFIYRGEAQDMGIAGDMIGARAQEPMHRVSGTDLFFYSTQLEPDARISYRFIRNLEENFADPRNPRKEQGMQGEMSWIAMPKWQAPAFFDDVPRSKQGKLVNHEMESKYYPEKKRHLTVYLPAGYDVSTESFPVVYIHGGKEAEQWGELPKAFHHLLGRKLQPFIAVFVWPITEPRTDEYYEGLDQYLSHLVEEVVPFMDRTYRTIADAKHRANAGASFAGYAALYCTFKRTDIFQQVATHSTFMLTEDLIKLENLASNSAITDIVVRLAWGRYDLRAEHEGWNIAKSNEELASFLKKRGFPVHTLQATEGHSWGSWRNRTDWLFADLFPIR